MSDPTSPSGPPPTQQPQLNLPTPASITLPPAEIFDLTAPLHELLARILAPQGGGGGGVGSGGVGGVAATALFPDQQQQLDIQQLGGEVSEVRSRIRRARAVVEGLPDVERTVEEQEAEMRELKEKVGAQREMLGRLGGREGKNGG